MNTDTKSERPAAHGRVLGDLLAAAKQRFSGALVAGLFFVVTGFGPDEWIRRLLKSLHLPERFEAALAQIDPRTGLVAIGVALIGLDFVLRNFRRRTVVERDLIAVNAAPANLSPVAVLSAIVDEYSRLVALDAAGVKATLKAHKRALDPAILNNGGRVFHAGGDGLLVHFPGAAAAVDAAMTAQEIMQERNAASAEDRRMALRIGIHAGEASIGATTITGDAVDVAARLSKIAPPGGVACSLAVQSTAGDLALDFKESGVKTFPNVKDPISIWIWTPSDTPARQVNTTAASAPGRAAAVVAVMPFVNLGGDSEQDYFADGVTEDLINALSRQYSFRVLGRNSTFSYKGKAEDTRLVARELDANYLVNGSVRRTGEKVRVAAELIRPENGEQLWSGKFDGHIGELLALQDEITSSLGSTIAPEIVRAEFGSRIRITSAQVSAWDCLWKGLAHYYRASPSDFEQAIKYFRQSIALDETLSPPRAWLAMLLVHSAQVGYTRFSKESWSEAHASAEAAIRLDGRSALAFCASAVVNAFTGKIDEALVAAQRAIELNPFDMSLRGVLGQSYFVAGEHEKAIELFSFAQRFSPNDPANYHWAATGAFSHYLLKNYDAALAWARLALHGNPDHLQVLGVRAAALAQLGRMEEAANASKVFMAHLPGVTVERHLRHFPWKNPDDIAHYGDGLIKSGVPAS